MTVPAAMPLDAEKRLATLHRYAILDTGPDPSLDRIVRLVARQFNVPTALILLVDENRQWIKASCGLAVDETSRNIAFCAHAVLENDVFVVPDAREDSRFANNPLVTGDTNVGFYAGATLTDPDGCKLGTLCLMDTAPRYDFSSDQRASLHDFAAVVSDHIDMRYATRDARALAESHEELRKERSELELILNHVPLSICYKNDENRILRVNKAAAQLMGATIEDIEGANTHELFPEFAKAYHEDDLEVINSGQPKLGVVKQFTPLGSDPCWVRTDRIPFTDPDSDKKFVLAVALDITAQKKAEQSLQASEARYRSLYNDTPAMLHSVDSEGKFVSVSDYWLEKMGYCRDEVLGRRAIDFLTDSSAKKLVEETLLEFDETGISKDVEFQVVTKTGEVLDVLVSATGEYDRNGTLIRTMAVVTDITDRRSVERQLVQSQKMESVGQLTGGLAHDFNNLLAVIQGNLELVNHSNELDEKTTNRLNAAAKAATKGAELTHQLLMFSRRQLLETTSIELNSMIENMSSLLKRTLGEAIVCECTLGDDIPRVNTDLARLESAVLNLAVNARDAMPHGGKLTIESSSRHLDNSFVSREGNVLPGDYVVLSVTDEGEGIAPENVEKVFEPFFTTKEVGKGSGLGLSMVYGLVKQSGGHIEIKSKIGLGTTFELYFPADSSVDVPRKIEPGQFAANSERHETVLVVEDQSDVREMAANLLEELGYSVLSAKNGWEAVEALKSNSKIDLLFTDMIMPEGMNGKELAQVARTLRPNLPVVFTSGYVDAALLSDGEISPDRNLIAKPYLQADLSCKIRAALGVEGTGNDGSLALAS